MSNNPQNTRLSQLPASPSKQMITVEEADGHLSYNYTSSGLTNDPLQELHQRFLGLLFQFTFTALLLYAAVLALTYISVRVARSRPRRTSTVLPHIACCPTCALMAGSTCLSALAARRASCLGVESISVCRFD